LAEEVMDGAAGGGVPGIGAIGSEPGGGHAG